MKFSSLLTFSICLLFPSLLLANNVTPIAVITHDINRDFFFDGESVTFDGTGSYDRDESGSSITAYSWTIDGSIYTSSTPTVTFSLTSGQQSKTVAVKLKVRDDENTWSSEITKTYTVRRSQQRYFYVKDHLGSVRVTVDEEGEPIGYDDYYPFGLVMPGRSSNVSNPDDMYKYTGHERDNEIGLDLTYAGARYLDPVTGIWLSIDPKVDDYPGWSPYNYSLNNPVNLIDPDGEAPTDWVRNSDTGVYEWRDDVFSEDDAPEGYEYVGKGQADIQAHYNENTSFWGKLFGSGPEIDASNLGATIIQFDAMRHTTSLTVAKNPMAWIAGGPAGAAAKITSAGRGGRVFWSGGDIAKNSAMNFAKSNGMKTLEMTTSGRIMNTISPYLPRSVSSPIWDGLSRNFARGATGNINVFQNAAGVSLRSTWRRIEYPILRNNNIIFHTVK
ncbi:RHS repeat-associated core domain-containing protein [Gracilimonas tropica]|uniref:RHS repeat-associated core domain-containing protein n=1 Tax=Gracilimonas tropica TaxID=454600 RepID=UPI00035E0A8F|nr:RHS repeat-associated core domain-containing protein [Gracilimonas tropica]